jgi:N-acetylglucosaminyldiphosphoundecaprenol N-acetyl-beta-D-mannosaminyltransferase
MKQYNVLGIPVHEVSLIDAVSFLITEVKKTEDAFFMCTPNAEIVLHAQKNTSVRTVLKNSLCNTPDSVSMIFAIEVLKRNLSFFKALVFFFSLPFRSFGKKRASGADLLFEISKKAEEENLSIGLLGGKGEVPQKTKEVLLQKFPRLRISCAFSGDPFSASDAFVVSEIQKNPPDILFVAYGCPLQEEWMLRNYSVLRKSVKCFLGVGGSFDFASGKISRAPKILSSLGFEWLYRWYQEPSRILRIFRAVFVFPIIFLLQTQGRNDGICHPE